MASIGSTERGVQCPKGTKTAVVLDTDDFDATAKALACAELLTQDFEKTIRNAEQGDLVYADPPYAAKRGKNSFGKYNATIFSWKDQVRLKNAVVQAIGKGVKVAVSNTQHESVKALYRGIGRQYEVSRQGVIAGGAEHRGPVDELLILSW